MFIRKQFQQKPTTINGANITTKLTKQNRARKQKAPYTK